MSKWNNIARINPIKKSNIVTTCRPSPTLGLLVLKKAVFWKAAEGWNSWGGTSQQLCTFDLESYYIWSWIHFKSHATIWFCWFINLTCPLWADRAQAWPDSTWKIFPSRNRPLRHQEMWPGEDPGTMGEVLFLVRLNDPTRHNLFWHSRHELNFLLTTDKGSIQVEVCDQYCSSKPTNNSPSLLQQSLRKKPAHFIQGLN